MGLFNKEGCHVQNFKGFLMIYLFFFCVCVTASERLILFIRRLSYQNHLRNFLLFVREHGILYRSKEGSYRLREHCVQTENRIYK